MHSGPPSFFAHVAFNKQRIFVVPNHRILVSDCLGGHTQQYISDEVDACVVQLVNIIPEIILRLFV